MAAGVLGEGVRGVEAHGLGVEQPSAERRRVVVLEPGTGVHQVGERPRVALGEAVVGEGGQLVPEPLDHAGRHPPFGRPGGEAVVQDRHASVAALGGHGLPQPVGLDGAEPGHVDGQLHELLLEQRDAEGLGKGVLAQRVRICDRFPTVAATDVGVDRAALDGARADEGHLDHQVVEAAGPQPGQGGHLGTALDLEHADGVGGADHVVDGVLLGQKRQVDGDAVVGGDQVDCAVEGTEHAEPQQVELDEARRCTVVLVPLQDAAVGPGGPLDRADLAEGTVADDHAAGVDAEVAGGIGQLGGQLLHLGGHDGGSLLP